MTEFRVTTEPFHPAGYLAPIWRFGRHRFKMTAFALDNPGHHPRQGIEMTSLVSSQLFRVTAPTAKAGGSSHSLSA